MIKKRTSKQSKEPISTETLVAEYLAAASEAAKRWRNVNFDLSASTIPILEEMLEELYTTIHVSTLKRRIGLGPSESDIVQWANLWGIYLGEVLRREFDGRWTTGHEEGPSLLTVEFHGGEAAIFPTARVFRRLNDGAGESVVDYYHWVRRELVTALAGDASENGLSESGSSNDDVSKDDSSNDNASAPTQ